MPPLTEWIRAEMILMIRNADAAAVPMGGLSEMEISLFARDGQFDDDDDDLRPIKYMLPSAYELRMSNKRKRNVNNNHHQQNSETSSSIGDQFL